MIGSIAVGLSLFVYGNHVGTYTGRPRVIFSLLPDAPPRPLFDILAGLRVYRVSIANALDRSYRELSAVKCCAKISCLGMFDSFATLGNGCIRPLFTAPSDEMVSGGIGRVTMAMKAQKSQSGAFRIVVISS